MIPVPANVRIWIATGHTDMRRGMTGLALQVQEISKRDPHAGDLYLFRGKRGDLTAVAIRSSAEVSAPMRGARLFRRPRNVPDEFRAEIRTRRVPEAPQDPGDVPKPF